MKELFGLHNEHIFVLLDGGELFESRLADRRKPGHFCLELGVYNGRGDGRSDYVQNHFATRETTVRIVALHAFLYVHHVLVKDGHVVDFALLQLKYFVLQVPPKVFERGPQQMKVFKVLVGFSVFVGLGR